MISKERDKVLWEIAAARYEASKPNAEAHKLAAKIKKGSATEKQKRRLQALCEEELKRAPRSKPAFLLSEAESERVHVHILSIANLRKRRPHRSRHGSQPSVRSSPRDAIRLP
jgi:hypothetical protein